MHREVPELLPLLHGSRALLGIAHSQAGCGSEPVKKPREPVKKPRDPVTKHTHPSYELSLQFIVYFEVMKKTGLHRKIFIKKKKSKEQGKKAHCGAAYLLHACMIQSQTFL